MRRSLLSLAAMAALISTSVVHAQTVPFNGSFTGNVTQSIGRCGPTRITLDVVLTGFLSPFGAVTGTQSGCVNPGVFDVFDGQFELIFAGGGTLFGSQFGSFTPLGGGLFTGSSTFTITGGTGRFAGATGGATSNGTQNLALGTVAGSVGGAMTAPGLVPEPSTWALMATGLVAIGAVSRKRRV